MIDPQQPFELTTKAPLIDGSNMYSPGVYRPGELPAKFLIPAYGHNAGNAPAATAIIGDPSPVQPLVIDKKIEANVVTLINRDLINFNVASIDDLTKVEGIGTSAAGKIIADRDKNGAFNDLQNLLERFPTLSKFTNQIEERFHFNN